MTKDAGKIIAPGGTIGILGGGQLGRMLVMAAARLGLDSHVFCPEERAPASRLATHVTQALYDNEEALRAFAERCDVITFEFENIPFETVAFLAELNTVRPGPRALRIAQDRLQEKTFLNGVGIKTAPFLSISNGGELVTALQKIGVPSVLKMRKMGYDGKGQVLLRELSDREAAWDAVKRGPSILEAFIRYERELSVIAARGLDGEIRTYDITENLHENQILRRSAAPAQVTDEMARQARYIATQVLDAVDYVGVLAVELFETEDGALLVNEIAPRVHNSGHWTLDACIVNQFEQHIRAISGWPLGAPVRHSDAIMENIIGPEADKWTSYLEYPDTVLHLYGKRIAREGRKMGHITRLFPLGRLPNL